MGFKEGLSLFYYLLGAIAAVVAVIKVLYGWFREYDNANQFVEDLALLHIPYLQKSMGKIAAKLGVDLDDCPPINFSHKDK